MAAFYDEPSYKLPLQHTPSNTGLSVPGTAASATVLLRIPILPGPRAFNRVRLRMTTGGTAAGPTITFGKSLAGTGTVAAIGTYAFGTSADGTAVSVDLTSTEFLENDEFVVTNAAGTAASTPVIVFGVGFTNLGN